MRAICKKKAAAVNSNLEEGKKYKARVETGYHRGRCALKLILDNGDMYIYGSIQLMMRDWKIVSEDEDIGLMDTLQERDKRLEEMWDGLADVPFDPKTECIEDDYLCFPAGTERMDIWRWFDARHSKGVAYLLYRIDPTAEDEKNRR